MPRTSTIRARLAFVVTVMVITVVIAAVGPMASGQTRDINGHELNLFRPAGKAGVLVFVASDCPISNTYAPEIRRLCARYAPQGIACSLIYEDADIDADLVRKHLEEFRYEKIAAAIDRDRKIAQLAKASVTPQAVVIDASGQIRYRGRIDNFYAALGKPRQRVSAHDLRDALDAVLAGRPVPNPETEALGCFIDLGK